MRIKYKQKTQKAVFRLSYIMILFACSLSLSLFMYFHLSQNIDKVSGEIPNEVYIWQRQWNNEVTDALSKAAYKMSGFAVLATEISFRKDQVDKIVSIPINYQALRETQKPVALTLRIGSFSGEFRKNPEITDLLGNIACSLIEETKANDIETSELQIDFDCAESKLADFRELVKSLKEKIAHLQNGLKPSVPIIITVLPCWLKHSEFMALARETNGFVLQVHSLERPKGPAIPMKLCDFALSRKWVKKAAHIGVPFRVALPTYGYIVGFDSNSRFLGLSAEGPSKNWPEGTIVHPVYSDANDMSKLVASWQMDRPSNMKGIIWYRLPVKSDQLNWKWETLGLVMSGRRPKEAIELKVDYPQSGLAQIALVNTGQMDYLPNARVKIECAHSEILDADGMNGFVFDSSDTSTACFKTRNENNLLRIKPGEQLLVGWLRLNGNSEVKGHVSEIR
jgi:hypothetical protein